MSNMMRSKTVAPTLALHVTLATIALGMLAPSRANAQDQAAIDKLVQMNKRALEDYDTLEWDAAKKTLLDALVAGKKAGLDNHPVMARTYVHLGAVYITGFKSRDKALQSFVRALEIDANIALSKGISTSEVLDAFGEAQRKVKGAGAGGGGGRDSAAAPSKRRRGPVMEDESSSSSGAPSRARKSRKSDDDEDSEPDLPARINALDCPEPDEAILEKPVTLRCALSPRLPATKVLMYYRAPGGNEYEEVEMTKSPKGWFQGKIPKKAVVGKSLQFYFEAQKADGKPVARNGEPEGPNIMLIVEADQAGKTGEAGATGEDEEENPLDIDEGPKKRRVFLGRRDTSTEGLDTRFGKRRFWIGLGAGSGFGYAKGDGLEAVNMSTDTAGFNSLKDVFTPGGAWAGMVTIEPEFGYHLSPDFAISIAGRFQYIQQPAKYRRYSATGALSALAKFWAFTKQSQVRFFGTAMVGGGEGFRFIVVPDPNNELMAGDFRDTVRGGPIVAGAGGGVYYEASKLISIVPEVDLLAGFPLFGVVLDATLNFQFNLY